VRELGEEADNPFGLTLYAVTSASGSILQLQTKEEADWYIDRRDRYQSDNAFTNISDLQELDRMLILEVMVYRWSLWIGQGFDYMYARVDDHVLKNAIREYSSELRAVKQSLGIDKSTRDKDKGTNLADYVTNLLNKARIFGYHRNEQYEIVVTKFHELSAMVKTHDRCTEDERNLLDLSSDSILQWIRDRVIAPMDEHAEAFKKDQSMWIKELS
jgi:hypothetical protein